MEKVVFFFCNLPSNSSNPKKNSTYSNFGVSKKLTVSMASQYLMKKAKHIFKKGKKAMMMKVYLNLR